jgi:hypothetical protein
MVDIQPVYSSIQESHSNSYTIEDINLIVDQVNRLQEQLEEIKAAISTKKAELMEKLPQTHIAETDNLRKFAWHLYWDEQWINASLVQAMVVAHLGDDHKLWHSIIAGKVMMPCDQCSNKFAYLIRSRSQYKELWAKHKPIILCPECTKLKEQEQARQHEEWRQKQLDHDTRLRELRAMPYPEYLESPEWQDIRKRKLKQARYKCELCNATGTLDVHHRTYERRGDERLSDLIVLCRECHSKHHAKDQESE